MVEAVRNPEDLTDGPDRIPVLLVDDDEEDFIILERIARKIHGQPFDITWEPDVAKAEQLITEGGYQAYLVDYRLGAETGLDLLGKFNLFDRVEPFIIMTGAGDEGLERQAMDLGVSDYLVKGSFDAELLSRVIRYSIQRKAMEAQRIEQLKEIGRSKDEFIALASHQLRTPATAVKQYIGMLMDGYVGDVSPDQMEMLRTAYDSNERQLAVVNDILRVAQLDLDKVAIKPVTKNLHDVIQGVLKDVRPAFNERSQDVHYSAPDDGVHADVDNEYFTMALGNIIENASKYTPSGGAIHLTLEGYAGGSATIEVRDEGVGIAAEDMDKLFKKFSRIANPLSVEVGGSGLGLYWANQIVELHDGTIQVSSTPGKGSTFLITLPPRR